MIRTWAKTNSESLIVVNVEQASDEWVAEHHAANPDADYKYMPTDPEDMDYAGIGYTWDADRQRFIPPSPFPSFVYDEQTYAWVPPIPYPSDGETYTWDEDAREWRTHG